MFKKLFLSIALIASTAMLSNAQGFGSSNNSDEDAEVLRPWALLIGPEVGGNYSVVSEPDGLKIGTSGTIGFHAGLAANVRFGRPAGRPFGTERFGIKAAFHYAQYGVNNDIDNITLNCYEVPVWLQWYVVPTLAVELGPTFTGAFSSSPERLDLPNGKRINDISATDVKFSFGLSVVRPSGFHFGVHYNLGTSDLHKDIATTVSTVSINLGYYFTAVK